MAALGLTDSPDVLHAERIAELFQAVDAALRGAGLRAPIEIVVVGGAAVALQWNRRRTTYDVDVVSEGIPAVFWDVTATVGRAEGLTADWLNAAARVKAPSGPTPGEPTEVYVGSNLRVYGASPHYVLAMKLLTGRDVDIQDIPVLLEVVQPETSDELYDLVEHAYPTAHIPASARYTIEQSWDAYTADRPDRALSGSGQRREHRVGLSVQPTLNRTYGWDMAIRSIHGEAIRRSPLYPTRADAEAAARFAVSVVDVHYPLHFAGASAGGEAGPDTVTVSVVSSGAEHRLVGAASDGELVAHSDPYTAVTAHSTLAFVEALSHMVGDPRGRRAMRVNVDTTCDCRTLRKGPCRHHQPPQQQPHTSRYPPNQNPATTASDRPDTRLGDSPPARVHVRPYLLDNHGWEVATTEPDSHPRPLSGPHPTLKEAEEARDFLVRLVNVHPKLHIPDEGPEPSDRPTVAVFNHCPNEPWYLLCLNADGTVDDQSPPYPSNRAAATVLDQLRPLIETTTDYDIGHRATAEPTSNTCRCSQAGWRCEHVEIEAPETDPPPTGTAA